MTNERKRLDVMPRDTFGSSVSRRIRGQGLIPGVLYGAGEPAEPFVVAERELRQAIGGDNLNAILDVYFEGNGKPRHAVLRDHQLHPTRSRLLHIDLQTVRLDQPIEASVPIQPAGIAPGLTRGGLLNVILREVRIEGLPMEIPEFIEVDISGMEVGDSRHISDLVPSEGIAILDDPGETVLTVAVTRVAIIDEEEAVAEEEELEEGEEPEEAEGGAPTDAAGEAPARE